MEAIAATSGLSGNLIEYVIGFVVAVAVLRVEVLRRAAGLPRLDGACASEGFATRCKKLLRRYAPEAIGLVACLALAAYLRVQNTAQGAVDEKTWAEIMRQWPILLTADTLLALQAMLRVLVLVSSALRVGDGPSPLSHEAAAISCGAAIGRAVLWARCNAYMLDGPLGGNLPVACELLTVPLLIFLSRGISRRALAATVFTLIAAARIAQRNRLALANDNVSDSLFIFAHIVELLAAFAYLSRALLLDCGRSGKDRGGVALWFAHIVMPVQQCLSAYYFVQAFDKVPELVGAGHPFEILQMGGIVQLGAFAAAAVLHVAEYLESPAEAVADRAHADARLMPRERLQTSMDAPRNLPMAAARAMTM